MRIKKFTGPDIKHVTNQMRQDLGSDAIVLNTRRLSRGGLLGAFGNDLVEITAAIDEEEDANTTSYKPQIQSYAGRKQDEAGEAFVKESVIEQSLHGANQNKAVEGIRRVAEQFEQQRMEKDRALPRELKERAEFYHLKADVQDMRTALTNLTDQLKEQHTPQMPERMKTVYAKLLDAEVDRVLAGEIISGMMNKYPGLESEQSETIEERLIRTIAGAVKAGIAARSKTKRAKVIALVGPTGVGKTTTIAKLAAREKLLNRSKVGLITADTYRIGAIEQLRTFASIADIPMEVVYRPADVAPALKNLSAQEVIYVDTVGRNQKAKKDLADLKKMIDVIKPDEIHLVLSASTSESALNDIAERYAVLNPNQVIISKVDEAVTFGPLFNIVHHRNCSISYFTTGQGVPDDIATANGIMFASMLYRGVIPNV